ncbi:hypothetical protein [Leeia aquatica]|uniref:Uncharacterized protein n=1 Tax=Leeia aquatica TaxID=2725557 RepID=A0A847S4Y6_9NEIS|nr:hypothetical protein [Leeia aquatica]NLR74187.1 hypothetical protein [Leeia aquatica]
MDNQINELGLIDYTDALQCKIAFDCLIRPSFDRLNELTRQEVKKSLGYLVENPTYFPDLIEDRLLLCGVPFIAFRLFLSELWNTLFPLEDTSDYKPENYKIKNKPLALNQYSFSQPESESLQDRLNELYKKLLNR